MAVPVRRPPRRAGDRAAMHAGSRVCGASPLGPSLPDSSSTVLLLFVTGCAQGQCSALQVAMTAL